MARRDEADEAYIIDLCDRVLGQLASRQHKFDFLKGDGGHRLPVDAYYPNLHLVIEYHEIQHFKSVPIMDRKPTISGVPRGEQRQLYVERRRIVLPGHGIRLVELDYTMFALDGRKRLRRTQAADEAVVRRALRLR